MKILSLSTALVVLGLTLGACSGPVASTSQLKDDPAKKIRYGIGLDTLSGEVKAPCVEARTFFEKTPRNDVRILVSRDREELATFFRIDRSHVGRINSSVSSDKNFRTLDPRIKLSQSMIFDPFKTYVLVAVEKWTGEEVLDSASLIGKNVNGNPTGPYALYQRSYPNFLKACGDSFVTEMNHGQAAYVLFELRNVTADLYEQLTRSVANVPRTPQGLRNWLAPYFIPRTQLILPAEKPEVLETYSYDALNKLQAFWDEASTPSTPVYSYVKKIDSYERIEASRPPEQAAKNIQLGIYRNLARDIIQGENCVTYAKNVRDQPYMFEYTMDLQDVHPVIDMASNYLKRRFRALGNCEKGSCDQSWSAGTEPDSTLTEAEAWEQQELVSQCFSYLPKARNAPLR